MPDTPQTLSDLSFPVFAGSQCNQKPQKSGRGGTQHGVAGEIRGYVLKVAGLRMGLHEEMRCSLAIYSRLGSLRAFIFGLQPHMEYEEGSVQNSRVLV